ncbi:MAG: restriction endonuclease [Ignavibacteriales bacterium CG07_land_8_20_14_0_80_59_12]|nr:MAG: restriction endonuclease [Ignavibacteriales bacterium CG07_land_8_20_14_0_80_59_12]
MAIPDYQSIMLPLLTFVGDNKEHSLRETIDALASRFSLTPEERRELLASGKQTIFGNRVGWARTYLKKAAPLESPRRAYFRITKRGLDVLASSPKSINLGFLEQFPEFVQFRALRHEKIDDQGLSEQDGKRTPEEALENSYQSLRQSLASELLDQVKSGSPHQFEKVVVELLVAMGYGGSLKDAGRAVGKSGDEGIDGIIKEDRLGLDAIFIQAKKWENSVSRLEIQKFAGALQGQRARKGIFITTSDFPKEAHDYVSRIDTKIVLIDGQQLAQLMIDHNIGVTTVSSYEIKRIDSDFFAEE